MKKNIMMASLLALGLHSAVNAQIKLSSVTTTVLTGGAVNTVILGDGTTTGTKNTYIGNGTASGTSASGNDNTFVGQGVAPNNTGNANTFIGKRSGEVNTGSYNAFLGENSGVANTTGYYNTYLGTRAGVFSETGYENTFIGLGAGWENKTGNRNTLLGTWANFGGINKDKLQYATAIGYNALVSSSNAMSLGGLGNSIEAVKVGIGTDVPTADLHIEKSFNAEAVSIMSHSKRTDFYSSLNLRTGNSIVNDLILVRFGSTFGSKVGGAGNFFPAISGAGSCPAVSYDNFGMIAGKNGPLSIGTIENSAQNIHFFTGIRSISTGTSLKAWECLRINNANGFVGIHTRTATTGLGSGDPQALFHVNLTQPGQSDLVKHTQGIRFEGLPTYNPLNMPPHPDVIVVDAEGNLALQDKTTLGGGAGPDDWHVAGNFTATTTPAEFIGTRDIDDFRIRTNNIQRARITVDNTGNFSNFDFGSATTSPNIFFGTSDKSAAFGTSNQISNANASLAIGTNNQINNSSYNVAFGETNIQQNGTRSSIITGELNTVDNGKGVAVFGSQNQILNDQRTLVSGSNNILNNNENAGIIGMTNTVTNAPASFTAGISNTISSITGLTGAIALGGGHTITNSEMSAAIGEGNEITDGHGTVIAGGHNSSTTGGYNFLMGHWLTTDLTPIGGPSPFSYTAKIIIGERINNPDLNYSHVVGFNRNRTIVTTARGMAVQLNPSTVAYPTTTYKPTVNFEVEAGIPSSLGVPPVALSLPSSIRSNIRFHNLPKIEDPLPVVLIDPITGELFRSEISYPNPPIIVNDSNQSMMISDLKKSVEEQKTQIANQQKQIDQLLAAVKVLSDAKQNETLAKINIELSDKDAIVLNQNIPNPCDKNTSIGFSIPASVQSAKLNFTTMDGKVIKSISIAERGKGLINIYTSDLSSGVYLYSLIADGKLIDTKRIEIER